MSDFCTAEAFEPAGSTLVVRVVHPSGALGEAQVESVRAGKRALAKALPGADIQWTSAEAGRRGAGHPYLAGEDETRLAELIAAIDDDTVDVIWAARGGSGGARIAPRLLAHLRTVAHKTPKILVGFSDITTLLSAWVQVGWPAVHGPVMTSLDAAVSPVKVDLAELGQILTGRAASILFPKGAGPAISGRLVGGNLTVLASLAGTAFLPRGPGLIWVLEDTKEPLYKVERCLCQLRMSGALEGASAVWLGSFTDTEKTVKSAEVAELCRLDLGLPVVVGAPAGHEGRLSALPFGVPVTLDPSAGSLTWQVRARHA